jgi:hypothetical protein
VKELCAYPAKQVKMFNLSKSAANRAPNNTTS